MSNHLLLKFHYKWESANGDVNTMDEHKAISARHEMCLWGRTSSISQIKADQLKSQLEAGIETWIFLYSIWVPKKVHEDRTLWYVGKLRGIELSKPKNIELIPRYYRDKDLDTYFLISNIRPIPFEPGTTPKVPGQAAMRHLKLVGSPIPANIRFDSDERKSSGIIESASIPKPEAKSDARYSIETDSDDLKTRIIDLQADIIRLQEHNSELRTYKDYYQKILNTDYLFSSERFFESWLQENMHKIFPELDVVDRQPHAKWPDGKFGRLDLLAVSKETKDLCIIEVKTRKRSKRSGYDQFVRYMSWAKRNRQQLATTYVEYGLIPSDNPVFVIITDYVDDEMTAICKDHGITLIHVFGGLGFEKVA